MLFDEMIQNRGQTNGKKKFIFIFLINRTFSLSFLGQTIVLMVLFVALELVNQNSYGMFDQIDKLKKSMLVYGTLNNY